MKNLILIAAAALLMWTAAAQETKSFLVTLNIEGISTGGGAVYGAVFNSNETYKKQEALQSFMINDTRTESELEIMLPAGEYVVSVYQDSNGDGKLNTNFLGIPKEPVGISGYEGKGIPGGFDKLKTTVNSDGIRLNIPLSKI